MKILLIAPFERPESTAWLILKAMKNLGLNVEPYSYREEAQNLGGTEMMNAELNEKTKMLDWEDVIFVIKGELIYPETLLTSKAKKALWHFDFDNYQIEPNYINFWRNFKYIFLMCYPWVETLREEGINAIFMPQATDTSVFHPALPEKQYQCDVAFIGSWKPGREEILDELGKKYNVKAFGNGWANNSNNARKFEIHPAVYLEDFNKVCNSAKVVLNITPSKLWPIYEKTFSQRVYMVMAAGGYLVTDRIPRMPLKWLTTYDNIENLKMIINIAIQDSELREYVKRKARMEILQYHTYYHRIGEILKWLRLSQYAHKSILA